jgi:hypothetical protein
MFNKLINFFAPKDEENVPKEMPQQEVPKMETEVKKENKPQMATDTVTFRCNLLEAIVNKLRPQAFTDKVDGSYTLYVAGTDDDLNYQAEISKADFLNDLLLALENANITAVANVPWTIKTELPPKNAAGISDVMAGIRLQYVNKTAETALVQPVHIKARVSIWHGRGSLVQDSYLIDSTKQKTYNIGRGEFDEKTFHENHIAINDRESNQDKNELNTYVSQAHAKIVFVEGSGFCLQVLPGGSKLASDGRTRIIHGEDSSVEVQNLNVRHRLFNGDVIELGRKVWLKFETIDDNITDNKVQPNKGYEEEELF